MASAWGLAFGAAWADAWGVVLEEEEPKQNPAGGVKRPFARTPIVFRPALLPVIYPQFDEEEEALLMCAAM